MNLVSVIVIIILAVLLYRLLGTYDKLNKQLAEIRVKCIGPAAAGSTGATATK